MLSQDGISPMATTSFKQAISQFNGRKLDCLTHVDVNGQIEKSRCVTELWMQKIKTILLNQSLTKKRNYIGMTEKMNSRELNPHVGTSCIDDLSHYISLQRKEIIFVIGILNFLDWHSKIIHKCLIITTNTQQYMLHIFVGWNYL